MKSILAIMVSALVAWSGLCGVNIGGADALWSLTADDVEQPIKIAPPVFEIDGREVVAAVGNLECVGDREVFAHVREKTYVGRLKNQEGALLKVVFRVSDKSPVVRFRYELCADAGRTFRLTKTKEKDNLEYLSTDLSAWPKRAEVRISEYSNLDHAYRMGEREVADAAFEDGLTFIGPILAAEGNGSAALVAYEHGSQAPSAYVTFCGRPAAQLAVRAVKGNYWRGEEVSAARPYATIWFDAALVAGGIDALAAAFRTHLLKFCTDNAATRKPWIYYDTWTLQERDYWWRGSRRYLNAMNEKEMLAEIDAAHEMGIEIFELDTGWFEKTGDWCVSRERFPHGLGPISEKLKGYGMKLGLWFNPLAAAVSSDLLKRNRKNLMRRHGVEYPKEEVWESESSQFLCLVSDYWKDLADEFIRLYHECGVTYFKLDGVGQGGCDAAGHCHGDASVPEKEREECCAFELSRYLGKVVERLRTACPEAIVDYDISEGGRAVGLEYLEHGRFIAFNNGPYLTDFDQEYDWKNPKQWINMFVKPGPARPSMARRLLNQDKWIPVSLFLGHYLPDAPRTSQIVNLASLVLGQGGIRGELHRLSLEDRAFFNEVLTAYKRVRDDVAAASPVRVGETTGSPEVHEKLANGGRGVVSIFANEAGEQIYVTHSTAAPVLWKSENVDVTSDAKGRALLRARFVPGGGAALVIFGN